jgi:hypothetical protein
MKQILLRSFALVLILGLVSSAPLMNLDPTGGIGTTTSARSPKDTPIFKYFFSNTLTGPTYSYDISFFDLTSATKKTTITYASSTAMTVKAISENMNCAILYDATASSEKLRVIKYDSGTGTATEVKKLIAGSIITAADVPAKSF